MSDLEQATADSLAAWEKVAPGWGRQRDYVWDASREVGELLVGALDLQPGCTVLELAAGPGDTGFLAAARIGDTGRLLSTDFSPEMVAIAAERSGSLGLANVEHRVVDAQAIGLPSHSIDGVLCRWGYMLMPDPLRALEETRRVLRPGGRVSFSVWADAAANPWASAIGRTVVELGYADPPEPDAPGPFRLADTERVRALVANAGFEPATVADVPILWRHASFDEFWTTVRDLSFTLASTVAALAPEDTSRLRGSVETALQGFTSGDGSLTIPGLTRNVLAGKPLG
jgi:SAM-dependent methyltransferase